MLSLKAHKKTVIGCSVIALMAVFTVFLVSSPIQPYLAPDGVKLTVSPVLIEGGAKGGISSVTVRQYVGSTWVIRGTLSSSGGTVTVQPNQQTKFTVKVYVGWDIGGSSEANALLYSKSLLSIAGEGITNVEMTGETVVQTIPDTGRYVEASYTWSTAGKPVSGTTYTITIDFQCYY